MEQSVAESKRKANRTKSEFVATLAPVRSAFRGEPRPRDVVNVLQISRNQLLALEASETATRPAIVPQGPPARIRQYMKGGCTMACQKYYSLVWYRAFFKWLSKVITWLRSLRSVIGLKDSRQFFYQWEAKPKLIAPCTRHFSRALSELQVISRDCDWFIALCAPVVIGRSDCLGFGFSTVIWKPLYTNLFWFVIIIIIILFIFTILTIIFTINEN